MSDDLTHFDQDGAARMVDVGHKTVTTRKAIATGSICMQAATLRKVTSQTVGKGDVLGIARIAGIMAAKKTAELIPLCHPLALSKIEVGFETDDAENRIKSIATVETRAQTGVEMEALVAVQAALSTIYDMCKAVDRGMLITDVGLEYKSGGQSGEWKRGE